MRIIFVRHGQPNYEKDCLTETGKQQALDVAERLAREGITEIYSSPFGRARETAGFTARKLNLPVTILEYMHEVTWGGKDIPDDGHPWMLSERMVTEENFDFFTRDWMEHPYFQHNAFTLNYQIVCKEIDCFLTKQGYIHNGTQFRCVGDNTEKTIAIFSHGGSGACVLGHILNIPFPYLATMMTFDFTSVTIVEIPNNKEAYIHPRLALFNDCAHIGKQSAPAIQTKKDI